MIISQVSNIPVSVPRKGVEDRPYFICFSLFRIFLFYSGPEHWEANSKLIFLVIFIHFSFIGVRMGIHTFFLVFFLSANFFKNVLFVLIRFHFLRLYCRSEENYKNVWMSIHIPMNE